MMSFWLAIGLSVATWAGGPDVAVVCHPQFRPALMPWVHYRQAQGHRIAWVSPDDDPRVIRKRLIQLAQAAPIQSVLIVGDHGGPLGIPTFYLPGRVSIHFGSEPVYATDGPYGDIDGDRVPDLAVGRWSVDEPEQIAWQIEKVRVFESARGAWRQQLHLVIGTGGFGPAIDGAIEQGVKRLLTRRVPDNYRITLTRASWRSPYCPAPEDFRSCVLDRLNEGGLFWVYAGHGQWNALDFMDVPSEDRIAILRGEDAGELHYRRAPSIALFFSCYAGAFDANEALAERFVRARGGPVAAFAASRVSMPFGMTVMATGLMDGYFEQRLKTLGRLWLSAQHRLAQKRLPLQDRWLEWSARLLSPKSNLLQEEKREHIFLFNLLGDPLLRLPYPEPAQIAVAEPAVSSRPLKVTVDVPFAGRGYVALINPRQTPRQALSERTEYPDSRSERARFTDEYRAANDLVWTRVPVTFDRKGRHLLSKAISVPPSLVGKARLWLFLESDDGRFASAVTPVDVAPVPVAQPAPATPSRE